MGKVTWVKSDVSRALSRRPFCAKSTGDNSILGFALVPVVISRVLGHDVIAWGFESCHFSDDRHVRCLWCLFRIRQSVSDIKRIKSSLQRAMYLPTVTLSYVGESTPIYSRLYERKAIQMVIRHFCIPPPQLYIRRTTVVLIYIRRTGSNRSSSDSERGQNAKYWSVLVHVQTVRIRRRPQRSSILSCNFVS